MSWYERYPPKTTVAEVRIKAAQAIDKARSRGQVLDPVTLDGRRTIARTFWGQAWCEHFEAAHDYANRLPRGRSYVRHNAVIDLQIEARRVTGQVVGSRSKPYRVELTIAALPEARWQAIVRRCGDQIDTLVDLLQGKLGDAVIETLCDPHDGMLPQPRDIRLQCSCPDWATMCKHAAAVLYAVGARLDDRPELLFRLRDVDEHELVAHAATDFDTGDANTDDEAALDVGSGDLAALFDIELDGVELDLDDGEPAHGEGEGEAEPGPPADRIEWLGRAVEQRLPPARRRELSALLPEARVTVWQVRLRDAASVPALDPVELLADDLDALVYTTRQGAAWIGLALPVESVDFELLEACVEGRSFVWHDLDAREILLWRVEHARVADDPDGALRAVLTARKALLRGDTSVLRVGWLHAWSRELHARRDELVADGTLDEVREPDFDARLISREARALAETLGVDARLLRPRPRHRRRVRTLRDVFRDAGFELRG